MIDRTTEHEKNLVAGRKPRLAHYAVLGGVCALVIGVYVWCAKPGWLESWNAKADDAYYNLLVQGFRSGQLNLKREVPAGLAQLSNPYDPKANDPYLSAQHQLLDLSYYKGKLYLYFGVTPALALFWPYREFTGHCLRHKEAVVTFFSVGFLVSAGLLWAVWRRYFAEVRFAVVVAGVFTLGLANFAPAILQHCDVWEVAISCGYALTMVTLALLWRAMHAPLMRIWWLAGASLTYGLAVGARPSLVLGAIVLLVPVVLAWRNQERAWPLLLTAAGPILLIGMGLMLYNYLRFDNPLEFGQHYQLNARQQNTLPQFSPYFFWFNFRVGFLAPAGWNARFPFVHDITVPPLPRGYNEVGNAFGVLTNLPVVWLALFAPLAWRGRQSGGGTALRCLGAGLVLLFGTGALVLCLHNSMSLRYELEYAMPLLWLGVMGVLGLERALAGRPVWHRATRWIWSLLLVCSVTFNVFAIFGRSVESYILLGRIHLQKGQLSEAMDNFQKALAWQPDNAQAQGDLGTALVRQGRMPEAIRCFERALQLKPDFVGAHSNLGKVLFQQGKIAEAIGHYEQVLRLQPDNAEAHNSLGVALLELGRLPEAIEQSMQAVRLKPDYAEAHNNLGAIQLQQGKLDEAVSRYEQALRLDPNYPLAHYNLASALFRLGRVAEAIGHYEQALKLKPDFANAYFNLGLVLVQQHNSPQALRYLEQAQQLNPADADVQNILAWLLATSGEGSVRNGRRAVELAEQANQLGGGKNPGLLDTLAAAYAEAGRFGDAVRTAQAALELAQAAGQAEPARQIQARLQLYQAGRPYHEGPTRKLQP